MDRRHAREALRLLDAREPFVRATVVQTVGSVPGKLGASMIVRADGSTFGTVGGAALEERVKTFAGEALTRRAGGLHHFDLQAWAPGGLPSLCGGSVDIALEYVASRPNLLLWGGGHVARALAEILPTLEYDFSVADDRPDWVGADRFPAADRREVVAPEHLWDVFDPAAFTHAYLLGYDAQKDLEALAVSLERFPNQIGLIASASKREHMYDQLRSRGVTRETLTRIRSPVGLEIGSETPAEIAVSIVAEIVQERHPTPLRTSSVDARAPKGEKDAVVRTP
ncbi:MAG TPA: XdhC/CoxI family protein [Thermoplasmata archaeon]|nr:XdhC/CoxI family protein [Thermoplasmata archaeon]